MLLEELDQDIRVLSRMKFDDLPNEDEWNLIQSEAGFSFIFTGVPEHEIKVLKKAMSLT